MTVPSSRVLLAADLESVAEPTDCKSSGAVVSLLAALVTSKAAAES